MVVARFVSEGPDWGCGGSSSSSSSQTASKLIDAVGNVARAATQKAKTVLEVWGTPVAAGIPVIKDFLDNPNWLAHYEHLVRSAAKVLSETKTDCERLREVRVRKFEGKAIHVADEILAHPEQYQSRLLRFFIRSANHTAQLAEFAADFSGVVDKFMRNAVSGGNKKDVGMMFGSMCGRLATMKLNILGFAIHKLVGTCLFGVSSILSFCAVFLAETSTFGTLEPTPFKSGLDQFFSKKRFPSFLSWILKGLANKKELLVFNLRQQLQGMGLPSRWLLHFSSESRYGDCPNKKRLFHSNYMWDIHNLKQYHGTTRFLMVTAHGLHALVNRFCISHDKHLACWVSKNQALQGLVGRALGERVANTFTTAGAFVLSMFVSHWVVGFAAVGAIACFLAIVLLFLAKGTAWLEYKVFTQKYAQFGVKAA